MPDTTHEYKGIDIVINSKELPDGSWIAIYSFNDNGMKSFTAFPITGPSKYDVERKALEEVRSDIDKESSLKELARTEAERQASAKRP